MTDAEARIHRAFSSMPYGGAANLEYDLGQGGMSLETIANNLEKLKARLEDVVRETMECNSLKHELDRELLGASRLLKRLLQEEGAR